MKLDDLDICAVTFRVVALSFLDAAEVSYGSV